MKITREQYIKQLDATEQEWSTMDLDSKRKKIIQHLDNLIDNSQEHEQDKSNLAEAYKIILTEGFPEKDQIEVVEVVHKAAMINCWKDMERICSE